MKRISVGLGPYPLSPTSTISVGSGSDTGPDPTEIESGPVLGRNRDDDPDLQSRAPDERMMFSSEGDDVIRTVPAPPSEQGRHPIKRTPRPGTPAPRTPTRDPM